MMDAEFAKITLQGIAVRFERRGLGRAGARRSSRSLLTAGWQHGRSVIEWSRKPRLNRSIMREAASLPIRISATPSPALSWNALAPKPGRLLVVLGLVCEPPIASR
jgi:hypothetical protein